MKKVIRFIGGIALFVGGIAVAGAIAMTLGVNGLGFSFTSILFGMFGYMLMINDEDQVENTNL